MTVQCHFLSARLSYYCSSLSQQLHTRGGMATGNER